MQQVVVFFYTALKNNNTKMLKEILQVEEIEYNKEIQELKSTRNGIYEDYYKIYFSYLMAIKDNCL